MCSCNLNNRANAISSINSLFSDVEDKARRLMILKSLVSSLHLGDNIADLIQQEVEAAEEAARKAKEAEEAEAEAGSDDLALESTEPSDADSDDLDLELAPMPDSEIEEDFEETTDENEEDSKMILVEDGVLMEDADDLPTPEEIDINRDFTENL